MNRIIDSLQRSWRLQGWVRFGNLLDAKTVSCLPEWADALEIPTTGPCAHKPRDEKQASSRSPPSCNYTDCTDHAQLSRLVARSSLPDVASGLLGGHAVACGQTVHYQYANQSGCASYIGTPLGMSYRHSLTCLVAIEPMTRENGCPEFAKGSAERAAALNHETHAGETPVSTGSWDPVTLPAGGVLFISPGMAYRSGPNRTKELRRALHLTYCNASKREQPHQFGALPPENPGASGAINIDRPLKVDRCELSVGDWP